MERFAEVTTGSWPVGRTAYPASGRYPVVGPSPAVDPSMTGTQLPPHLVTQARVAPASPAEASRPRATRPPAVAALAVGGGAGLLVGAVSVVLPWHDAGGGSSGIVASGFGLAVLVVHVALLATVVVDLLEGRVRWTAAVLLPPLAVLVAVAAAGIAALLSGTSIGVHLALTGIPWPGPVMSGPGLWVFIGAQVVCLAAGVGGVLGWWRGWGDPDPSGAASPRRALVLVGCAVVALAVIIAAGTVLADQAPTAPRATVGGLR